MIEPGVGQVLAQSMVTCGSWVLTVQHLHLQGMSFPQVASRDDVHRQETGGVFTGDQLGKRAVADVTGLSLTDKIQRALERHRNQGNETVQQGADGLDEGGEISVGHHIIAITLEIWKGGGHVSGT